MTRTLRFKLSWRFPDNGAVLTFNEPAWSALQSAARTQGFDADEMISLVVAGLVGRISNLRIRQ
jgi:hypothetical protein